MNLTLSKRGDYVVRSAICLARAYDSGEMKKLREISIEMGIPRNFVSQILGDLVRADLAVSSFGRDGGFRLTRPPVQVNLLQVVEAGEGPLIPQRCALGDGPCRWDAVCPLHEKWSEATASLCGVLAAANLAELAERDQAIEAGTYPIPPDAHRLVTNGVAISDSVHVERSASDVAKKLNKSGSWFMTHAEHAEEDGEEFRVRVGLGGPAWLDKTVAVRLGTPEPTNEGLHVPLEWEATGPTGLFPRFVGQLTVLEVDPERSELSLVGCYRPPLGQTGMTLDEALLARVAQATVRSFLRRVALALEESPENIDTRTATAVPESLEPRTLSSEVT